MIKNSPAASARVLAMVMMVDGAIHPSELAALDRGNAYAELGLTRDAFLNVASDLFEQLMIDMRATGRLRLLDDAAIDQVLAGVDDPARRATLYRWVVALLPADGHLRDAELAVLQRLLDRWQLPAGTLGAELQTALA
jgi:uncharacterized tellurite resistance protein B-like protein